MRREKEKEKVVGDGGVEMMCRIRERFRDIAKAMHNT